MLLDLFNGIRGFLITMVIVIAGYLPDFFFNDSPKIDIYLQRLVWTFAILAAIFTCISCYYNIKAKRNKSHRHQANSD